jgi:hypothetical protein
MFGKGPGYQEVKKCIPDIISNPSQLVNDMTSFFRWKSDDQRDM